MPELSFGRLRGAEFVGRAAEGDFGSGGGGEWSSRCDDFLLCEGGGEQFCKVPGADRASGFDVIEVWGEATGLVPGGDVEGGGGGQLAGLGMGEHFAGDVAEADAVTVCDKAGVGRHAWPECVQRFIVTGGGHAVGVVEEGGFEGDVAAGPFGDFKAGGDFGFSSMDGMSEQAWQQRGAGGALDELGGANEQPKDNAHEGRDGQIAGGDVDEQFGTGGEGEAAGLLFRFGGDEAVEAVQVAEVLDDELAESIGG